MPKKKKLFRTDSLKFDNCNIGKVDSLMALLEEYRKTATLIRSEQLKLFSETGKNNKIKC